MAKTREPRQDRAGAGASPADTASLGPSWSSRSFAGSTLVVWLLLGGVTLVGAVLRLVRLGESPAGFMAFNEYFYLDLAKSELPRDPFAWFYNSLDLNNPPLYNGLISTALRLHLPIVAGPRLISVLAGLATILVIFLLGRLLYDERTGLIAAAAFAVMPGVVIVNHNIQVDSVFVALLMAGVYFYVRLVRFGATRDAVIGGVLLGLAMLAKQPALLALVGVLVWRTWAQKGIGWVRDRRTWAYAACTLGVGGSWYAMQLIVRPQAYFTALNSVASNPSMGLMNADFLINVLGLEFTWMVFPLALLFAAAGLAVMVRRRSAGDLFVLVLAGVYFLYYVGFHKHSYYLLPLAPFTALMIARGAASAFDARGAAWGVRAAVVSALFAAMVLGSAVMMGGKKWGRWAPMDLQVKPARADQQVRLYYNPKLDAIYWAIPKIVSPGLSATSIEVDAYFSGSKPTTDTQRLYLSPTLVSASDGGTQLLPANRVLTETRIRPVLFGVAVGEVWARETRAQTFRTGAWTTELVGPPWQFGVNAQELDSDFALYD